MVTINRLKLITLETALLASAVPQPERQLAAPGRRPARPPREQVDRAACFRTLLAQTAMAAACRRLARPAQLRRAPSTRLPAPALRTGQAAHREHAAVSAAMAPPLKAILKTMFKRYRSSLSVDRATGHPAPTPRKATTEIMRSTAARKLCCPAVQVEGQERNMARRAQM